MDKLLLLFSILTIFMGLINKCVGEACGHQCANENACNFKNVDNTCYYVFKDKGRTWLESKQFCEDQGLSMVKITKKMIENGFDFKDLFQDLPSHLFQTEHPVWLGGRALDLDEWTFLNDTLITSLKILKPNDYYVNISYAQCGRIKLQDNKLELGLQPCYYDSYFLCRFENCATNSNCWRLLPELGTWFEARSYCLNVGGDLFYLKDGETLDSFESALAPLLTSMFSNTNDMDIFIGLRHVIWQWFDATEIIYTKWAARAPNTYAKTCLVLHWASGIWNENLCNDIKLAFCQLKMQIKVGVSNNPNRWIPEVVTKPSSSNPEAERTMLNSIGSKSPSVTSAPLRTYRSEVIILAVLLGVALLAVVFLTVSFMLKHLKKTKPTNVQADVQADEAGDYEIPVMNDYVNDGMANNRMSRDTLH